MFNSNGNKTKQKKICFSSGQSPWFAFIFVKENFITHNTFGNHTDAVLNFDFVYGMRLVKINNRLTHLKLMFSVKYF